MNSTNPFILQNYILTKRVLSDEGIKYFTKIFDELRELASVTSPFTSKQFKSTIHRIYEIGNELKTNKYLPINNLDKFDKYYINYLQPFLVLFSIMDEDIIVSSLIGNTNNSSSFGHAEELDEHKDMLILQITGAVFDTITEIINKKAS